jgi:hypothetical protein
MKKQRSWARLHSKENPLPHVIFEFRLNLLGVPHERERERDPRLHLVSKPCPPFPRLLRGLRPYPDRLTPCHVRSQARTKQDQERRQQR